MSSWNLRKCEGREKVPLVKRPNQARIKATIWVEGRENVKRAVKIIAEAHGEVVEGWALAKDKPKFIDAVKDESGKLIGTVLMIGQDAEKAHVTVWTLLQWGTDIRFMGVSEDWKSKTAIGQLTSGPGRGHTTGLDFKDPQRGIDAREWIQTIDADYNESVMGLVRDGWARGFSKAIGK